MLDYSQINSLKRIIDSLESLMETIDRITGAMSEYGLDESLSLSAGDMIKRELESLLLHLMASDGVIGDEEVAFINRLFEHDFSAQQWKELIVEADIYTDEFAQTAPLSLYIAAYADEYIKAHGGDDIEVVDKLIEGFSLFGKNFLGVDGDVSDSEVDDLVAYIFMLRNSVEDARRQALMHLI